MKAILSFCHMCGSYYSELITPAFLQNGDLCKFQEIVICKDCGLVYKNPVIPELNNLCYSKLSWGDGNTFKARIKDLSDFLIKSLNSLKLFVEPKIVLEVGPGPGWLAIALRKNWQSSKFLLLEASLDVAELTKKNIPEALVVPSSIEEINIEKGFVDLALVCGVDYLFSDYRRSMDKIYDSISENGYLYIERNVFVDSEAYAGFPINSYSDLFGQNALMTTWFSVDQYRLYLLQYYEILFERSFVHDETDGHKCIIYGFLCQKKTKCDNVKRSFYEDNIKQLEKLASGNKKKQTSKSLISRLSNFKKHK